MTEEDFKAWKHLDTTQAFFQLLEQKKKLLKDSWAARAFPSTEDNATALGAVDMLNQIGDIEYVDFDDE